jgi:hypothetical protein
MKWMLSSPSKFLKTHLFRFHHLQLFLNLPGRPSGYALMSILLGRPLECLLRHQLHKPVLVCVDFFLEMMMMRRRRRNREL